MTLKNVRECRCLMGEPCGVASDLDELDAPRENESGVTLSWPSKEVRDAARAAIEAKGVHPLLANHSTWCELHRPNGRTCDCDWFEKEGRLRSR